MVTISEIDNGFVVETDTEKYTYKNLDELISDLPGIFSVEEDKNK